MERGVFVTLSKNISCELQQPEQQKARNGPISDQLTWMDASKLHHIKTKEDLAFSLLLWWRIACISAWTSSLFIKLEFHRVSNCRVQACI